VSSASAVPPVAAAEAEADSDTAAQPAYKTKRGGKAARGGRGGKGGKGKKAVAAATKAAAPAAKPPAAATAPPPPPSRLGAGDGLHGPSALYCVCRDMLQSSLMDATKSEHRRDAFFAAMTLFHHMSRHSDLAGALVYTPASMERVNPTPATSSAAAAAGGVLPAFRAWLFPPDLVPADDAATVPVPHHSIAGLVSELCKQATVFVKSSTAMKGVRGPAIVQCTPPHELMSPPPRACAHLRRKPRCSWVTPSTTSSSPPCSAVSPHVTAGAHRNPSFTHPRACAVSRDLEVVAGHIRTGLHRWISRLATLAAALDARHTDPVLSRSGDTGAGGAAAPATTTTTTASADTRRESTPASHETLWQLPTPFCRPITDCAATKRSRGAAAAPAPAPAAGGAGAAGSGGGGGGGGRIAGHLPPAVMIAEAIADAKAHRTTDPAIKFQCGYAPVVFTPPPAVVASYESVLREEAFSTVEGLRERHHYRTTGATAAAGAAAALPSPSPCSHPDYPLVSSPSQRATPA